MPLVYRVLNRFGEVSEGWKAATPDLPATPDAVRQRLAAEGVRFDDQTLRADQSQRWTPEDAAAAQADDDGQVDGAVITDDIAPAS